MTTSTPATVGAITPPILLAPLAGYTDLPFRMMIRELGGLGMAFTEMLHPLAIVRGGGHKIACLLATEPHDAPLGWQIYGRDPDLLARAARVLVARGASWIDLNMGCPVRKIVRRGEGAALLKTPDLAVRIAEAVVHAVPSTPVSVKIRIGWDDENVIGPELAPRLVRAGVAALIVHGRTAVQGFKGKADWRQIARVVEAVPGFPVYGNGDIACAQEAASKMKETGCAGLMIGRGALKNPWLIREIAAALAGQSCPPRPTREEVRHFTLRHLERTAGLYGRAKAAVLFRKWMPLYVRPLLGMKRPEMVALMGLTDYDTLYDRLAGYPLEMPA